MKIKTLSIELFFVASFLIFFLGLYYTGNLIERVDLKKSIFAHIFAIIFFILGLFFHLLVVDVKRKVFDDRIFVLLNFKFYFFSYFFAILGLVVTLVQVSITQDLLDYLISLSSGNFNLNIRDAFLLESNAGGLSGIIKMWGNSTLAVVLMLMGIFFFFETRTCDKLKVKCLFIFSTILLFSKNIFSLDVMSLFAFLAAAIFLLFKSRLSMIILIFFTAALIIKILDFTSKVRLEEYGILDKVILYFYLHFVNFELVIETADSHSFGFNSFFSPINFIFKFFSIDFNYFDTHYDWRWNPAQYGVSYFFLDFGYFYVFAMFVMGFVSSVISKKAYSRNILFCGIFFIVLYGFVSFVTVPAIRGPEFYIALLVVLIIIKLSRIRVI